ncbi:MAG TPA: chemotaxis protein CheB [Phycisphaerales bacterium]|nr:chemotaxis protein CheB [Phycisphaerales bacterium]
MVRSQPEPVEQAPEGVVLSPGLDGAPDPAGRELDFPIVGVGASAGGLEALTELLGAVSGEAALSFLIVQHLDPTHESILAKLLGGSSNLTVVQATDRVTLRPGTVHVIPPDAQLVLEADGLRVVPGREPRRMPVDVLFQSLAQVAGERAIGVVLSGMGEDGAVGLREIKAAGGIGFVQDPQTARFDSMPRAALATGVADFVLTPRQIGLELERLAQHPYLHAPRPVVTEPMAISEAHLQRLYVLLRQATGVDFSFYKTPTIKRRLQRRMALRKAGDVEGYLAFLGEHPAEVRSLYQDMLIHVTRFFREPESFRALSETVFPEVARAQAGEAPVRVWVPGCSTGEEAYSVAIALEEFLGDRGPVGAVQVFATDISEAALERARLGQYPAGIAEDVSPERLRRFFVRLEGGYQISKPIRERCVFARQDLTRDPPFSKLDLIVCRNVLIYLGQPLQQRIISIFHYALRPTGFLMLGGSETTGPHGELFAVVDKKHRIYRKKLVDARPELEFAPAHAPAPGRRPRVPHPVPVRGNPSLDTEAMRVLLDRYAPPAVIVDADLVITQSRGRTGTFLELPTGGASLHLLKMAREGLLHGLRSAVDEARRTGKPARKEALNLRHDGRTLEVAVEAVPLSGVDGHLLIVFQGGPAGTHAAGEPGEPGHPGSARARGGSPSAPGGDAAHPEAEAHQLRLELESNREYLHSIIQDLEAANEELQSANEEILSSNEELQSTNEELDTAREELQSTNEEIQTVNEELHARNEELSRVNSDLVNLLGGLQMAIVIVDQQLRIRRFTPMAERVLNLIAADVGRRIGHIKPEIDCPNLEQLITRVIDEVTTVEREARDHRGGWYALRVRPYKSAENRIDGAVLSLVDISAAKQREREIRGARELAATLLELLPMPLALLDPSGRVRLANRALGELLGVDPAELPGRRAAELGPLWGSRELLDALERAGPEPVSVALPNPGGGGTPRSVTVSVRRLGSDDASSILMALASGTETL